MSPAKPAHHDAGVRRRSGSAAGRLRTPRRSPACVNPVTTGPNVATVEFRLYGPNDTTCATAIFTSSNRPLTFNGGEHRGDRDVGAVHADGDRDVPLAGVLQRRREQRPGQRRRATRSTSRSIVTPATPAITTQASADIVLGGGTLDGHRDGHRAAQPGDERPERRDGRVPPLRPERRDLRDGGLHVVEPAADVQRGEHRGDRDVGAVHADERRAPTAGGRSTAATPTTTRPAAPATTPTSRSTVTPANPAISTQASAGHRARRGHAQRHRDGHGPAQPGDERPERRDGRVPAVRPERRDLRDGDRSRRRTVR